MASHCVCEGCILFSKQLSLLTSVVLSAFCPGVFQGHCLKNVMRLSVYKLIFLLSPPRPQVCGLYPGDAEADPGADAGRSLAVLNLVHTDVSERCHSPPLHCRWVHSSITVKVTLHSCSAAGRLIQPTANMNSAGSSRLFAKHRKVHSELLLLWIC